MIRSCRQCGHAPLPERAAQLVALPRGTATDRQHYECRDPDLCAARLLSDSHYELERRYRDSHGLGPP